MAKKIFKYPIFYQEGVQVQEIKLPKGAEVLTCQIDQSTANPALWCIIDDGRTQELETRCFQLVLTGERFTNDLKYINTLHRMFGRGVEVHHIFEVC